jgi:hypothetical protein
VFYLGGKKSETISGKREGNLIEKQWSVYRMDFAYCIHMDPEFMGQISLSSIKISLTYSDS